METSLLSAPAVPRSIKEAFVMYAGYVLTLELCGRHLAAALVSGFLVGAAEDDQTWFCTACDGILDPVWAPWVAVEVNQQ